MTFIKDNVFQYLSVKLPALGAFIMLVLIPALQVAVDYQIIPTQYHAFITGAVMMSLSWVGRKIHQPNLKTNKAQFFKQTAISSTKNVFFGIAKELLHDVASRELKKLIKKSNNP